jgi:amino acid transporter
MGSSEKGFFVRPASGLVRELSTTKATFFNTGSALGTSVGMAVSWISLYTTAWIFGMPSYCWAVLIGALPFGFFYCCCLAILSHTMPRTGGDYVFTSRITNSFLGYLEGWLTIWGSAGGIAFSGWTALTGLTGFFEAGGVISPAWVSLGNWVGQPSVLLALGVVWFAAATLINMLPIRIWGKILTILAVTAFISTAFELIPLIGVTPQVFSANFVKYAGITQAQVISTAVTAGFQPSWFNIAGFEALMGYSLWAFVGYTYSTYLAGELRGNVSKNVLYSTSFALLFTLGIDAFFIFPFYNVAGYDFINAWSYLAWNAPSQAPYGVLPFTHILIAIARPEWAWFSIILCFPAFMFFAFILALCWSAAMVRILLAQTMDRLYPKKLAEVSERTHQPTYAMILMAALAFVFYAVYVLGIPAAGLWYTVSLGVFALAFPGINCLLLKVRRPDLFQLAPAWAQKKVAGLPVMAWVALGWLGFLVPVFTFADAYPMISGFGGLGTDQMISYMYSSGLELTSVLVAVGVAWYVIMRWWNKRNGIDLGMVFKAIPPE